MRLSKRQLEVLGMLEDEGDDGEIVAEGFAVYVGCFRTSRSVLNAFLDCMAVSDVSDTKGIRRYVINSTGRAIRRRPELAGEVHEHVLLQKGNFHIVDDHIEVLP